MIKLNSAKTYYFDFKLCSAPDVQLSVEPTVGGVGVLLRQGIVSSDTEH